MHLDAEQQKAVLITENAVVEAGAGSGKTSVLTQRYLRLVIQERMPVGAVLALTFTRKAAAEMYQRIYQALGAQAEDPFVAEQLSRFDTAQISTLDSFCAQIARNGCAAYGVPPTFTTDERALAELCDRQALAFLLQHQRSPGMQALIQTAGFAGVWKSALSRIAMNELLVARPPDFGETERIQREFLYRELSATLNRVQAACAAIGATDPGAGRCIAAGQALLAENPPPPAPAAPDGPPALETLIAWSGVPKRLSKSCGSSKDDQVLTYKELVDELRGLADPLVAICTTLLAWPTTQELFGLMESFSVQVLEQKRSAGLLSYQDVVVMAVEILSTNTALREYYRERFSAVMIDEFQDNNELQKELLFLLAGGDAATPPAAGRLFFVGDEKQSIYRFRGADVRVLKRLSAELAGGRSSVRLLHNYRSEPGLVRFFNELFSRVMSNEGREDEARFAPLESRAATEGVHASAQLWWVEPQPKGSYEPLTLLTPDESEAYHLANAIRQAVENTSLMVAEDGRARPAEYHDVAILFRSSSNQITYERMLRHHGVPYQSESVRTLFLDAPASDIYAALQLLVYPEDRVAYAALLRSPLVGLSDAAMIRVLDPEGPPFAPVDLPNPQDQERFAVGAARYAELCSRCGTSSIAGLVFHIWHRWGYRYLLVRRPDLHTYLEYYDYLMELARTYEQDGLPRFLDEVRRRLGENARLDEVELQHGRRDGVHLMTIHKSKGLEFPVVIIANATNRGRAGAASDAPYYRSDRLGVVFNTSVLREDKLTQRAQNAVFSLEREEVKRAEAAELKRLLYVAATRAEAHLIISGVRSEKDMSGSLINLVAGPFEAASVSLADDARIDLQIRVLNQVRADRLDYGRRRAAIDVASVAETYRGRRRISRPAVRREVSVTEVARAWSRARLRAGEETEPAPLVGTDGGMPAVDDLLERHNLHPLFGEFVHHRAERLVAAPQTSVFDPREVPPRLRFTEQPGVEPAAAAALYDAGNRLAARFVESELGRRLRKAAAGDLTRSGGSQRSLFVEQPLLVARSVEGARIWIRGTPDFVLVDDAAVTVVDLKTDARMQSEHHAVQLQLYREALEEMYRRPVHALLYYLRFGVAQPCEEQLPCEEIDAAVAAVRLEPAETSQPEPFDGESH